MPTARTRIRTPASTSCVMCQKRTTVQMTRARNTREQRVQAREGGPRGTAVGCHVEITHAAGVSQSTIVTTGQRASSEIGGTVTAWCARNSCTHVEHCPESCGVPPGWSSWESVVRKHSFPSTAHADGTSAANCPCQICIRPGPSAIAPTNNTQRAQLHAVEERKRRVEIQERVIDKPISTRISESDLCQHFPFEISAGDKSLTKYRSKCKQEQPRSTPVEKSIYFASKVPILLAIW